VTLAAETVKEIAISGNVNVKEKTIRSKIKTKKGSIYSPANLQLDMNGVLSLDFFDDVTVEVDTETYRVFFKVAEKPMLKKIEFKGNKKYSGGRLREEISNKDGEFLDRTKLEADKRKIIELYEEKGFSDTQVTTDLIADKTTNKAVLVFFISEGRKVTVADVSIAGTKAFSEKKVLKQMETRKKKVFKEKILFEDIDKILKFYRNNGFESAEISSTSITYNDDRTKAYVRLEVSEGPKYRISGVTFNGNKVITTAEIRKSVDIKQGQVFNQDKMVETKQAIYELYQDIGYLRAEINPVFEKYPDSGRLDVRFDVKENNVVYLDRIYIDGLMHTKEFVIRREILLNEKEPFSGVKLRRSMEKIYNLGFIDDVKVDIQDTETPDTADLVLSVTEGKPGMLSAGAGYSSVDQLVGTLQVSHMNLFGRAQRLNLLWEFGSRKQNYEIGWTEPWFLHKPVSFGATLFDLTRQQYYGNIFAYSYQRQGGEIRLGPRFGEYLSLLFIYSYEKLRTFDVDLNVSSTPTRTYLTSSFTGQVIYDSRDNIFDPSRGNRNSFSLQVAGGPFSGDVHYFKPIARSSWFFTTFWKLVFSVNLTAGAVDSFNDYQLTDPDKFHVGGPDTVRGYTYNILNPRDGAKTMFIGNLEYKFPIVQEKKRTVLQGAFFYDVGAGWSDAGAVNFTVGKTPEWESSSTWDNLMKAGWGFGIRFTTPVFPIRLDWGWPLQPRAGQAVPEFYFTIGQMF
jgi:outer membrane protein insertion porin family